MILCMFFFFSEDMDITECMQHGHTWIATKETYEYRFYRPPWCSMKEVIPEYQVAPLIPVRSFRTLYVHSVS